jgi:serine/threonine protein kinase
MTKGAAYVAENSTVKRRKTQMQQVITLPGGLELIEQVRSQDYVWEDAGYQPLLEREVVIRRLTKRGSADPRVHGKFVQAARTLAALHHHSLIQLYDSGVHDNMPYIVLEKLKGMTIQQRIDVLLGQRTHMDLEEVQRIMGDLISAVEYAHTCGVVLHSLSSDTITLTIDGRSVIAELGESMIEHPTAMTTVALACAAPERLFGGPVDRRSDVYSLGVLLYHLLFGQLPFEGSATGILVQKQTAASLPLLDETHVELPASYALVQVMRKATARAASQRYANVAAFREAFIAALDGQPAKLQSEMRLRPQRLSPTRGLRMRPVQRAAGQQSAGITSSKPVTAPVEELVLLENVVGEVAPSVPSRTSTQAVAVEQVRETSVVTPEPVSLSAIDPLMPGRDNPSIHTAIPYTILVPMPTKEEPAPSALAHTAVAVAQRSSLSYMWLVGIVLLGLISVVVSLRLG